MFIRNCLILIGEGFVEEIILVFRALGLSKKDVISFPE